MYQAIAGLLSRPWLLSCLILSAKLPKSLHHHHHHHHHHQQQRLAPPPLSVGFRTHALRRTSTSLGVSGDEEEEEEGGGGERRSKNEKKREARRSVKWGMELAKLSPPQIKRVLSIASLEEEVFDAIMLVKKLGPDVREGKRRQFSYIGRLLRSAEPELMEALIQASKDGDTSTLVSLSGQETLEENGEEEEEEEGEDEDEEESVIYDNKESENHIELASRWFDGLVDKDPSITKEVYAVHNVEFDRQELRKLVRSVQTIRERSPVHGEESDSAVTTAEKPLVRFLRSLAKRSLAAYDQL